jgi:hypothetical protein
MSVQTSIWSTAEHLASALFDAMPQILDTLAKQDGAKKDPIELDASHAAWRLAVARVIAIELKRINPDALVSPAVNSGTHVLVDRRELLSWERSLGLVDDSKGSLSVLDLVRTRMITASAGAARCHARSLQG